MRFPVSLLLAPLLVLIGTASAHAQLYRIAFKDPKTAKQYKNYMIEIGGELQLVGEAKDRITFDAGKNSISWPSEPKHTVELWVADSDHPQTCPYKLEKGQRVPLNKKSFVEIDGALIKGIQFFIREQSLWGLSKEYARRDGEIEDLRKTRDAAPKGTPDWNRNQTNLIQAMERMKSWLAETVFPKAAEKFTKEIEKEIKAAKDAKEQRLALAKAAIKIVPTPEDLAKTAKEVMGDAVSLHVAESQHVRIVYREEFGDDRIKEILDLAEVMIEGFRVQFVDPFLLEDFKDYIPEGLFVEYYFGPEDRDWYEQFTKKYYGLAIDEKHKEEVRAKTNGNRLRRSRAPEYVLAWAVGEGGDLEGAMAHEMGHDLVSTHYNQNRASPVPPFLAEAVGNWLSLEYLGRNAATCREFRDLEYATKLVEGDGSESGLLQGTADLYHRAALDKDSPIDTLALKTLTELEDADIAKGYSLFDYMVKTQGEKAQRWFRYCCNFASVQKTFIQQWRKKSEEIFGITGQDVFSALNDQWRTYAQEQTGAAPKKQ